MGLNVEIDIAKTREYAAGVQENASKLQQDISEVYEIVDGLAGIWKGEAAEGYNTNIKSFREDYENFIQSVNNCGAEFEAQSEKYKKLENIL